MKWSQHRALDGDTVHEGTVGGVSGGIDPAARSRRPATGIRSPQPLMSHFKLDALIISHQALNGFCQQMTGFDLMVSARLSLLFVYST